MSITAEFFGSGDFQRTSANSRGSPTWGPKPQETEHLGESQRFAGCIGLLVRGSCSLQCWPDSLLLMGIPPTCAVITDPTWLLIRSRRGSLCTGRQRSPSIQDVPGSTASARVSTGPCGMNASIWTPFLCFHGRGAPSVPLSARLIHIFSREEAGFLGDYSAFFSHRRNAAEIAPYLDSCGVTIHSVAL